MRNSSTFARNWLAELPAFASDITGSLEAKTLESHVKIPAQSHAKYPQFHTKLTEEKLQCIARAQKSLLENCMAQKYRPI